MRRWMNVSGGRAVLLAAALLVMAACESGAGTTDTGSDPADVVVGDVPGLPDAESPDVGVPDLGKPGAPDLGAPDLGHGPDAVDVGEDAGSDPDVVADVPTPPVCVAGDPCDDGDPCTLDDVCDDEALCVGTPRTCDDGRSCTRDFCDATGSCAAELVEGWCLIDAECHEAGVPAAHLPCHHCDPVESVVDWVPVADEVACDDGDACTLDDHCLAGLCVSADAVVCEAAGPCRSSACDPASGDCAETLLDAVACDDGDACTSGDWCQEGACLGEPVVCPPPAACQSVACDTSRGCVSTPLDGVACDDGDACTEVDWCFSGFCVGEDVDCDDGNDCTLDLCHYLLGCDHQPIENDCCLAGLSRCDDGDPCTLDTCGAGGACEHEAFVGPCDDGDACTDGDVCDAQGVCAGVERDCDDDNVCTADSCDSGWGCLHEAVAGDCDDGDLCTVDGRCVGGSCVSTPMDCDDGDPCTADRCEAGQCFNDLVPGLACDDDDACTVQDACDAQGQCVGVADPCDDGDPCTTNLCHRLTGCYHQAVADALMMSCDDGDECTLDDLCVGGRCVGTPGGCACEPVLATEASKVTTLAIGVNGHPGNGLDVDDNPATCAPVTAGCSEGIDNSMAGLSGAANGPLQDAVAGGDLFLIFEHIELRTDGSPYTLALLMGEPVSESCDFQAETCDYLIDRSSFDEESCDPLIRFAGATITNGVLRAGGAEATFPFQIPIQEGLVLEVVIYRARIVADVTFEGGSVVALDGLIAGAVPKQQILDAVQAIPDETFAEIGITKAFVLQLVGMLIQNDIDTDGDGTPDAASIGIPFHAIDANLSGLSD